MATMAVVALVTASVAIPEGVPVQHDVRPAAGWKTAALCDYDKGVARTPGDTPVYVFEGEQPGGTVLVAGGTHGNELAGYMAATLLVERARATRGRLIVVPHANNSAASYVEKSWRGPASFAITTASGVRTFRFGTRLTNPAHQGDPDPPKYRHPASAEDLDGKEARNLDRAYPGKPDGNLTERIAYAITGMIRREQVDVAFDFHEAGVNSRLAMMIVANPKNIDLGAAAVLALEGQDLAMKLEPSSPGFRGLSHREWGDHTPARAFLFETPSPAFDAKTAGDLVNDAVWPLARRVGVHLATMTAVLDAYNAEPGVRPVVLTNIPDVKALARSGMGPFLR
jgi:hypothetical protein